MTNLKLILNAILNTMTEKALCETLKISNWSGVTKSKHGLQQISYLTLFVALPQLAAHPDICIATT